MITNEFNAELQAEVTEINNDSMAAVKTSNGLSEHKKFVLVELPIDNQYPYIIFQNLSHEERIKCCEMLEKIVIGETYSELE
jgi:hypothetical protein